eukprot:TRINITY_DN51904_c0_g1_i1.p1 TRINITY_DN51904_c0_g1~~TRINITY_DN51904_c0_g1_i1.p1  ORF type:complete len:167 (-),score=35.00 TRINITY_DN51904_c0_g1_i1:110-610(-)
MSLCILLRHGTPVPEEQDPARPLSEDGQKEASFTANGIVEYLRMRSTPDPREISIMHSGKTRAEQTAEAVASALEQDGWKVRCESKKGLSPNDDPALGVELLKSVVSPIVVFVGHLPHMGKFSASLIGSPAAAGRLGGLFNPASGVVLEQTESTWTEAAEIQVGVS